MLDSRLWRRFDWLLLAAVVLLTAFGVAMIYSATRNEGNPAVERSWLDQAITAVIGLTILLLVSIFDYTLLRGLAIPLYVGIVAALALVLVAGVERQGARRWFDLGGFDVQPGELAKLTLTIVLARLIADRQGRSDYFRTIVISGLATLPCVVLILLQPNLSTALTIVFLWLVLIFVGGVERKHVVFMLLAGIAIVILVTQLPSFQAYQRARIELLLGLVEEPGANYQSEQALIALGNGGLWGQGYLQGPQTQLRFFPVRHTDFIFSVIGEELGFVGSMLFVALLAFVILRALRTAMIARDTFGRLICAGIAATLFLQTYINLGMQVGLMPVTGVTLPFVSYGRSSLISLMVAIGIVESVAMRYKKLEF
jgi:rod shape determining protein RodA